MTEPRRKEWLYEFVDLADKWRDSNRGDEYNPEWKALEDFIEKTWKDAVGEFAEQVRPKVFDRWHKKTDKNFILGFDCGYENVNKQIDIALKERGVE